MRRTAVVVAMTATFLAGPGAAADPPLTPDGWGDLKIGMRQAETVRRFKLVVPPDDEVYSDDCRELTFPPGGPNITVMTEGRVVTRLTLYDPSPLRTDRGFGVGSREADIRRAYGPALKVEPHHYEGPDAHYLTFWATPDRGVRYETDTKGTVTTVHVGSAAIQLVESCL